MYIYCTIHSVQCCTKGRYLALVFPGVIEICVFDPEDPVDGLGQVDDLDALVACEEGVAVGQDVKVLLPDEGDLKNKREKLLFFVMICCLKVCETAPQ